MPLPIKALQSAVAAAARAVGQSVSLIVPGGMVQLATQNGNDAIADLPRLGADYVLALPHVIAGAEERVASENGGSTIVRTFTIETKRVPFEIVPGMQIRATSPRGPLARYTIPDDGITTTAWATIVKAAR